MTRERERERIRETLAPVCDDVERSPFDGKTELQWMTDSCPSIEDARIMAMTRRRA